MKKKEYSSAEVEILLREMAAAYRCTMEETLTARILSAVEDELRRGRRRRLYKRSAQAAAALAVLGVVSFSVWNGLPSAVVASSVTAADMPDAKPHQLPLSDLEKNVTIAHDYKAYMLYKPQDPKDYGKPPEIYYQYAACTDSL